MRLDRVTITGADDSVAPGDLAEISERYPFVEWGILVSNNQIGTARFPSSSWLKMLAAERSEMKLSLHICGGWLRNLLRGVRPPLNSILPRFKRAQLNFHGEKQIVEDGFEEALAALGPEEFIFQIDGGMGLDIIARVEGNGPQSFRSVPLYDLSHGTGRLPEGWPCAIDADTYQGYAGGLGPDNLAHQIALIAVAAGPARFWIDMETKVRCAEGRVFDLDKVERCLRIAEPFVERAP